MRLKRPHKRLCGFLAVAGSWLELQEKAMVPSERHWPWLGTPLSSTKRGFGEDSGAHQSRGMPRTQGSGRPQGCWQPQAAARTGPGCRPVPGDGGTARPSRGCQQPGPKTPATPGQDPGSLKKTKTFPTQSKLHGFALFALWFQSLLGLRVPAIRSSRSSQQQRVLIPGNL